MKNFFCVKKTNPKRSVAPILAPSSTTRNRTISIWSYAAATCSGVVPSCRFSAASVATASTSTLPASMVFLAFATSPFLAQRCKIVQPLGVDDDEDADDADDDPEEERDLEDWFSSFFGIKVYNCDCEKKEQKRKQPWVWKRPWSVGLKVVVSQNIQTQCSIFSACWTSRAIAVLQPSIRANNAADNDKDCCCCCCWFVATTRCRWMSINLQSAGAPASVRITADSADVIDCDDWLLIGVVDVVNDATSASMIIESRPFIDRFEWKKKELIFLKQKPTVICDYRANRLPHTRKHTMHEWTVDQPTIIFILVIIIVWIIIRCRRFQQRVVIRNESQISLCIQKKTNVNNNDNR